ncbi:MAG: DUF2283 domain-containing protein [Chloroflexi bacterium]|nr:DUF2283 domain-containing protein [Chloroflexota bacterium]
MEKLPKPRAHYYSDTDTMIIHLADRPGVEAAEVAEDVILTYDADNSVVAIEILNGVAALFNELLEAVQHGDKIGWRG